MRALRDAWLVLRGRAVAIQVPDDPGPCVATMACSHDDTMWRRHPSGRFFCGGCGLAIG